MADPLTTSPAESCANSLRVADHMSGTVESVSADAPLYEAARRLSERQISCLVVTDHGSPIGIISERDLVRQIVREPAGWAIVPVRNVMSHPLHVTDLGATVAQAIGKLARHRIRRLPVLSASGDLAGIVTQTDLLRAAHDRLDEHTANLERMVSERTAELREITRQRDDLVDLTVHDIKNSLCVVESALEMVDADPHEAVSVLPLLRRATQRIGNLVCTLLDVNRLENGSMPLHVKDSSWSAVCEPVLAEVGLMAVGRSIPINRSGESHSMVRCDPLLIERVLLNLLDNAIGVAPDGTAVDVHAEHRPDGWFLVRVGNRGKIIPPELLPTLFRKYRQVDHVTFKRFGGWGLGLTFCRLAIERHGGTIRAISPYVDNQGAAFEFVIPAEPT